MGRLVQVLNEWEIQLLVLLSFTLQVFLFFTGGLRRRSISALLRFSMWVAYLAADLVAIYALGFLSRHKDDIRGTDTLAEAHPLAFLWAPFLLMHLGGQDTVTAFAIEDNNLWLRHLLNLVVQVGVALYVFWESTTGHRHHSVLIPGILVFIAGIIKYGERTLALMYGDLKNTSHNSIGNEIKENLNRNTSHNTIGNENNKDFNRLAHHGGYLRIFVSVLKSAPGIRRLFAGRTLHQMEAHHRNVLTSHIEMEDLPKLLEVELDLMYDEIYTKAMVLRTRSGIILRCVSQVSMGVAFVLFSVGVAINKHKYNRVDLAITYVLFIGGFYLEVCAMFILLMSPWTWAWLEQRNCHRLARISSFLLSSNIGRPKGRPLWSNSMGQYNFLCYLGCDQKSSWLSKLVKKVTRKTTGLVVSHKKEIKPLLWMSKLLDTKYVEVDKEIMDSLIRMICQYSPNESSMDARYWPKLGLLLNKLLPDFDASFGYAIVCFHIFTEAHQRSRSFHDQDKTLATACRKLSNYMLYLLVTYPEILPVSGTTEPTLLFFLQKAIRHVSHHGTSADIFPMVHELLVEMELVEVELTSTETLKEMRDLWTRLLIYCAGKSRAEMHAAQLSRGGGLLTFAWLLMAHKELGDVGRAFNFNLANPPPGSPGSQPFTGPFGDTMVTACPVIPTTAPPPHAYQPHVPDRQLSFPWRSYRARSLLSDADDLPSSPSPAT
ncbi:unnamed protein product [Triticum turgidum subsp. durum]|uniref:DUF4220 domain-containing protein n=1 Tax=Triticum turgidum subsp. durum TaxID=4567 RepID=A0A9R0XP89_TRITD|nr:unnamed protein product [Triticum turgidum subsp. durum]